MKSKTLRRRMFFCTLFVFPAMALIGIAQSHDTFNVISSYLRGRAGNCTLAESFESEALARLQLDNIAALRTTMRVIRTDREFSLWSTPAGEFWMPTASGDSLVYDLSEQKRNIYGTRIYSGDIVLDAGANVGVFTRKALRAGAAKVIAIEPGPENLECLRRNFAAEIAAKRVVIYPKGVWDKDDILRLSVDPASSAKDTFVRPITNAQYIEAPLTTIDKLVAELQLPKVDFIKMDIEGAEQKAVTGARGTIARFRPRMALCIYHIAGDERMIPKLVGDVVPDYKVSKTCLCAGNRIQPEVAFFY